MKETQEFVRIVNGLGQLYPRLMGFAATTAVNFYKERLVLGRDINNQPLAPRSNKRWLLRNRDKKKGRAIGIDTGTMKRDIQKIYVSADSAIVGTTRISSPYARVFNEGFKGTLTQNVKSHERRKPKKSKKGKKDKASSGTTQVQAYTRVIQQNIPKREIMGVSPFLDRRIQAEQTRLIIENIQKHSTNV